MCGITNRREVAAEEPRCVLDIMPGQGAKGTVRPVRLDTNDEDGPAYVYGRPVLSVRRDASTGALVFEPHGDSL